MYVSNLKDVERLKFSPSSTSRGASIVKRFISAGHSFCSDIVLLLRSQKEWSAELKRERAHVAHCGRRVGGTFLPPETHRLTHIDAGRAARG